MPVQSSKRSPAGTVSITLKPSESGLNYLTLRFSYQGKQRSLGLRLLDTPQNRAIAQGVASQIQLDLVTGQFDTTLDKYRLERDKPTKTNNRGLVTVEGYWHAYCNAKRASWKENTRRKINERYAILWKAINPKKAKFADLNAIKLNDKLLKVTKQNRAIFETLSAIHSWAINQGLLENQPNRFKAILSDLPKHNWQQSPTPKAFTTDQKKQILAWFDKNAVQYYGFVSFLFLTGCRPSEAVGLTWEQIKLGKHPNLGAITFDRSVSFRSGVAVYNQGSKNNRSRKFPVNQELYYLFSVTPQIGGCPYVFSTTGKNMGAGQKSHIHLPTLTKKYWKRCMNELNLSYEIYCCRDTFITEQIKKGSPIAVVSLWCDTSTRQIETRYLDRQLSLELMPQ
jgi:integrase